MTQPPADVVALLENLIRIDSANAFTLFGAVTDA